MMLFSPARVAALLGLAALAACADGAMLAGPAATASTMGNVEVGGAPMLPNRDIVDNAINSRDHTTFVDAVKAAGLVDTLKGPGPFTVFAPTNAAFAALPAGTVPTLLLPENRAALTGVLTYHVVPGRLDFAALTDRIRDGRGVAILTTLQGQRLTARMNGPRNILLADAAGNTAVVSTYDVAQSNGILHVIDRVLMPQR